MYVDGPVRLRADPRMVDGERLVATAMAETLVRPGSPIQRPVPVMLVAFRNVAEVLARHRQGDVLTVGGDFYGTDAAHGLPTIRVSRIAA
jgi:hypothetical protein